VPFPPGGTFDPVFRALAQAASQHWPAHGAAAQPGAGKARLLATFTSQRLKRHPDVPTVKELGHDLAIESTLGLVAPKNLDAKIAARLQAAFQKAAGDPAYLEQRDALDMQPNLLTGDAYTAYACAHFDGSKDAAGNRLQAGLRR
jgi:tripartite-type tricarboxylate transporter receptor subunit TctC